MFNKETLYTQIYPMSFLPVMVTQAQFPDKIKMKSARSTLSIILQPNYDQCIE